MTRDDYTVYRKPPERLRELEVVRLEEMSRSDPVSAQDAATDPAGRVAGVQEPAESIELTLAELRTDALANNLDLKVELVYPSMAQEDIREAEAFFEPSLFGSAMWSRSDLPAVNPEAEGSQSRLTQYDAGVRIPLRTGGTVTVNMPLSRFDTDDYDDWRAADGPRPVNPTYGADLSVSISQPLLRNAGIRTNTHAIRVAKYGRDISEARTKLEAIRILADADRSYWVLYAARRELDIRQRQYELALQQLEQAQLRVNAGAAPEIEIKRAESGVARRLEAIIISDTQVRSRERDLKRIMNRQGLAMNSGTAIIPTTDPNPLGLDLDAEALAEFAVENRMEMLELELRLAMDASTIDFERNATLPEFMLDYTYTFSGLSGSFNDSFHEVGRGAYGNYSLGLSVDIPIGNQAARSRLRRAVLQRIQRLATREQRRLAIRQEVFDAVDQLEQNWQRILAAQQEVVLAERTYDAETRQFEVGLRTSTEVLEAAARVADAQSREIRSLAAYEIAQIDIAFATGTLLGQDRVIWEPTKPD